MGTYYHNPNEPYLPQRLRYLQSESQIRDVTRAIQQSATDYNASITRLESSSRDSADRQFEAAQRHAAGVVGALNDMGDFIAGAVERSGEMVAGAIGDLSAMLDWRFLQMLDMQRVANMLSLNIVQLLRIPDIQKERQHYVEKGFTFYLQADNDPDLFADALDYLLKAESIEKDDYIVLYQIGQIYLDNPGLLNDASKAEDYFRRAAKYAFAELSAPSSRSTNLLSGDPTDDLRKQRTPIESIRRLAADAFMRAGLACYVLGKALEGAELSEKAFRINPDLLEARFNQAKFLAAGGQVESAVKLVRKVIEKNRLYAPKVAQDRDLNTKPPIILLLEQLRDEAVANARSQLEICRETMIPKSKAFNLIAKIPGLIDRNTYLDAMSALDDLTQRRTWNISLFDGYVRLEEVFALSIVQFVQREKQLKEEFEHRCIIAKLGREKEQAEREQEQNRINEETLRKAREKAAKALKLYEEAVTEEKYQNSKWGIFNFLVWDPNPVFELYFEAANTGSTEALPKVKLYGEKLYTIATYKGDVERAKRILFLLNVVGIKLSPKA